MTLEETFTFLNSQGWLLGSLCQIAPSDWYACLIDDEGFAHTATANNPQDAIQFAFERPAMGRLYSHIEGQYVDDDDLPIDLIALGLVKKREPVKRRF